MSTPKRTDQVGVWPGVALAVVGVLLTIVGRLLQVVDDGIVELEDVA